MNRKMYKLPEVLKELIKAKKVKKIDVIREAGVNERCFHTWIKDEGTPSLFSLIALAEYFNVSLDYLVYGDRKGNYIDANYVLDILECIEEANKCNKTVIDTVNEVKEAVLEKRWVEI